MADAHTVAVSVVLRRVRLLIPRQTRIRRTGRVVDYKVNEGSRPAPVSMASANRPAAGRCCTIIGRGILLNDAMRTAEHRKRWMAAIWRPCRRTAAL